MLGREINQYRIDKLIGESGSSAVYKARDQLLMRDVAIRVIKPSRPLEDDDFERFKRETLAAARFTDGPVCQVFEVDTLEREGEMLVFVVMELVPGPALRKSVKEGGLDTAQLTPLATELFKALKVLHARSVIHRNLNPDNVKLDAEGRLKLMDAGPAHFADNPFDAETYSAPELDTGQAHNEQCDIYSAGVILYELATGVPPVGPPRIEPPLPTELNPGLSLELESVILKCLFVNPVERFKNVDEVLRALSAPRATPKTAVDYWELDGEDAAAREDPFTITPPPEVQPPQPAPAPAPKPVDKSLLPPPEAVRPARGPGLGRILGFALLQIAIAALILGAVYFFQEYVSKPSPPPVADDVAGTFEETLEQPDLPPINRDAPRGGEDLTDSEAQKALARAENPVGYLSIAGIKPETAEVHVDGVWRARPVRRLELIEGHHLLEVTWGEKRYTKQISIITGEISWLDEINLADSKSSTRPKVVAPVGRGTLKLTLIPHEAHASVIDNEVDLVKSNLTPGLSTCELPEGAYSLDVKAEGYHSRLVAFQIEDSKTTELEITLERIAHLLSISATPPEAAISIAAIDGGRPLKARGEFVQTLPEGRYLVKISAQGYLTLETNVTLSGDQSLKFSLTPSG